MKYVVPETGGMVKAATFDSHALIIAAAILVVVGIVVVTLSMLFRRHSEAASPQAGISPGRLAFKLILLAAVADSPVVLCIDDLHWADRASVALLATITRKIHNRAALIIGTSRRSSNSVPSRCDSERLPCSASRSINSDRFRCSRGRITVASRDLGEIAALERHVIGGSPLRA